MLPFHLSLFLSLLPLTLLPSTHPQEVVPDWQTAASALLTTLGISHAPAVLQELLQRFQPGTTPHYFVVKTMGDLAMANGEWDCLCVLWVHVCLVTYMVCCAGVCCKCLSPDNAN